MPLHELIEGWHVKNTIAGVVAGVLTWIVVATILNRLLRSGLSGYAEAESAMTFTLQMMLARLLLGAVSTLCAGYVAAWTSARFSHPAAGADKVLATVLLVVFLPMHFALWNKFPVWYHLAFLVSLPVLTLLGARLQARTQRVDSTP
jgi:hypothetical protein